MMLETIRQWLREGEPMPVCKLVGMRVDHVDQGFARATLDVGPRHWTPFGMMHGGILCDLSDLAMGMAFMTTLGEGEGLATIELKINFIRPVSTGPLVAEGRVLHRGRSTGFVECEVKNADGKLVAKATSTCMVVKDDRAANIASLFQRRTTHGDS